jgi:AhpD family alkylhydroperoxidase
MRNFLGGKEEDMASRVNYSQVEPEGYRILVSLNQFVQSCGLERPLLELVKIRASQINGCAYCIDMHTKDARLAGESEQRIYALNAWEETSFYSERERAALAWTEAVTLIGENHVPDGLYRSVSQYFNEKELVDLALAVILINSWNRLAITFRSEPGSYQPHKTTSLQEAK